MRGLVFQIDNGLSARLHKCEPRRATPPGPNTATPSWQVFLTSRYLGIVMEYVTGGDLADMVDVWNVRNRKSHRARGPGEPIPHQCAFPDPFSSRCKPPSQQPLRAARPSRRLQCPVNDVRPVLKGAMSCATSAAPCRSLTWLSAWPLAEMGSVASSTLHRLLCHAGACRRSCAGACSSS